MKRYKLYWLDGKIEIIEGYDIVDSFNKIKEYLHYAIDNFDRKSDVEMTVCKGNKTIMTFENGR